MFARSNSTIMYVGQSIHQKAFLPWASCRSSKNTRMGFYDGFLHIRYMKSVTRSRTGALSQTSDATKRWSNWLQVLNLYSTCIRTYIIRYQKKNQIVPKICKTCDAASFLLPFPLYFHFPSIHIKNWSNFGTLHIYIFIIVIRQAPR